MENKPHRKSKIEVNTEPKHFAYSSAVLFKSTASVNYGERTRYRKLVTKRFIRAEEAETACENYAKLRAMGITLLPGTYRRVDPQSHEILMTDYTRGDRVVITTNYDGPVPDSTIPSIDLKQFEKVLRKMESAITTATKNHLQIPYFSYFAIFPSKPDANSEIDVVIGDLDIFYFGSSAAKRENADDAVVFLKCCVLRKISDFSNYDQVAAMIAQFSKRIR